MNYLLVQVWLLLLATTVIAGIVMSFFSRLYARMFKHQSEIRRHVSMLELFGGYSMYNINVLTTHGMMFNYALNCLQFQFLTLIFR